MAQTDHNQKELITEDVIPEARNTKLPWVMTNKAEDTILAYELQTGIPHLLKRKERKLLNKILEGETIEKLQVEGLGFKDGRDKTIKFKYTPENLAELVIGTINDAPRVPQFNVKIQPILSLFNKLAGIKNYNQLTESIHKAKLYNQNLEEHALDNTGYMSIGKEGPFKLDEIARDGELRQHANEFLSDQNIDVAYLRSLETQERDLSVEISKLNAHTSKNKTSEQIGKEIFGKSKKLFEMSGIKMNEGIETQLISEISKLTEHLQQTGYGNALEEATKLNVDKKLNLTPLLKKEVMDQVIEDMSQYNPMDQKDSEQQNKELEEKTETHKKLVSEKQHWEQELNQYLSKNCLFFEKEIRESAKETKQYINQLLSMEVTKEDVSEAIKYLDKEDVARLKKNKIGRTIKKITKPIADVHAKALEKLVNNQSMFVGQKKDNLMGKKPRGELGPKEKTYTFAKLTDEQLSKRVLGKSFEQLYSKLNWLARPEAEKKIIQGNFQISDEHLINLVSEPEYSEIELTKSEKGLLDPQDEEILGKIWVPLKTLDKQLNNKDVLKGLIADYVKREDEITSEVQSGIGELNKRLNGQKYFLSLLEDENQDYTMVQVLTERSEKIEEGQEKLSELAQQKSEEIIGEILGMHQETKEPIGRLNALLKKHGNDSYKAIVSTEAEISSAVAKVVECEQAYGEDLIKQVNDIKSSMDESSNIIKNLSSFDETKKVKDIQSMINQDKTIDLKKIKNLESQIITNGFNAQIKQYANFQDLASDIIKYEEEHELGLSDTEKEIITTGNMDQELISGLVAEYIETEIMPPVPKDAEITDELKEKLQKTAVAKLNDRIKDYETKIKNSQLMTDDNYTKAKELFYERLEGFKEEARTKLSERKSEIEDIITGHYQKEQIAEFQKDLSDEIVYEAMPDCLTAEGKQKYLDENGKPTEFGEWMLKGQARGLRQDKGKFQTEKQEITDKGDSYEVKLKGTYKI